MKLHSLTVVAFGILFGNFALGQTLPNCLEEQTLYTYTDCDSDGGRWRVQVPRNPDVCSITQPATPLRGKNCGFACEAGKYLDLASQECHKCPQGTFSLGSGVRFDAWDVLPMGFETYAESVAFAQYGYHSKNNNCSMY
uniref:Tyrosine-protein kinase ephrin type A/B receptor-like domain-containing protein n=1 Tax=Ciona intestinalis TaxID=7719 RepID=H2XVQ1_CIOIN